jgi:hypothetical protein
MTEVGDVHVPVCSKSVLALLAIGHLQMGAVVLPDNGIEMEGPIKARKSPRTLVEITLTYMLLTLLYIDCHS